MNEAQSHLVKSSSSKPGLLMDTAASFGQPCSRDAQVASLPLKRNLAIVGAATSNCTSTRSSFNLQQVVVDTVVGASFPEQANHDPVPGVIHQFHTSTSLGQVVIDPAIAVTPSQPPGSDKIAGENQDTRMPPTLDPGVDTECSESTRSAPKEQSALKDNALGVLHTDDQETSLEPGRGEDEDDHEREEVVTEHEGE